VSCHSRLIAKMMLFTVYLSVLSALTTFASATLVQEQWIWPRSPDHASTVVNWDLATAEWTSDLVDNFAEYCSICNPESANLWIMSAGSEGFKKLIRCLYVSVPALLSNHANAE
jgi:hypothetical protein